MIDETPILQNLRDLAFPRLSGTKYEKKCFNIVKQKIEDLNLTPKIQDFSFSIFYSRIFPKVSLSLLSWLLIILFFNFQLIFRLINLFIILIIIIVLIIITRNPEKLKIGREYHSQNLYVKISSQSHNRIPPNSIFLFSHLDSKGQTFSIKFRIRLYYIWMISFILSLTLITYDYFIYIKDNLILILFIFFILIINCVSNVLVWLNSTNNKSKGAIDNASGVSCVLEILRHFVHPKNRLKNLDLYFIFTGAEESGTMGIRNFYKNMKYFDRKKTYIINFDSIAKRASLWDHGLINNKYFKSINYILENKEIMRLEKTHRFYIGSYSDGMFLLSKKFMGIGNGDKSSYHYIHSVKDDVDKIEIRTLKILSHFYTILLNEVDINLNR
ncbi:MAG: M28 family peptidase [Candidatus Thorarchaeota archaeon]